MIDFSKFYTPFLNNAPIAIDVKMKYRYAISRRKLIRDFITLLRYDYGVTFAQMSLDLGYAKGYLAEVSSERKMIKTLDSEYERYGDQTNGDISQRLYHLLMTQLKLLSEVYELRKVLRHS